MSFLQLCVVVPEGKLTAYDLVIFCPLWLLEHKTVPYLPSE